jgi:hypothetical protein
VAYTVYGGGSTVTTLRAGRPGFDYQHDRISLFATTSSTGVLSSGVKRPGREADHSLLSTAEVKNARRYTSTPPYVRMAWCLAKYQRRLYL